MLPTPYGGVRRRPPLVSIGTLPSITVDSVVYYPKDARAFDFTYSADYRYIVIFVTYEADGEDDIGRIVVQNTSGTQKATLSSPYSQQEVTELDVHHSNDTMWIAHQNHFPKNIKRIGDESWIFDEADISGGPFDDENTDDDIKLNVSISQWRSDVLYSKGDLILPESEVSGTVSWIGTVVSANNNSIIRANVSGLGDGEYIPLTSITQDGPWYPYTILRVNKAFASSVNVGDSISVVLDFVEEGGDNSYINTAPVVAKYSGVVDYDYIKVNFGWRGRLRIPSGTPYLFFSYNNDYEMPLPSIPSADRPPWQAIADAIYGGDVDKLRAENISRGYVSAIVFGSYPMADNGGAYVTASPGNINLGSSVVAAWESINASYNKKPYGAITSVSAHADGMLIASTGHTFDAGDSVTIDWNSVYADGSYTVVTVVDEDSFTISLSYTSTATGSWKNSTYWAENSSPEESALVNINSVSYKAFSSSDVGRLLYCDKSDKFALSGNYTPYTTQTSESFFAIGRIELTTMGAWTGEIILETSKNGNYWTKRANFYSVDLANNGTIYIDVEDRDTQIRVRTDLSDGNCKWSVQFANGYSSIYYIVKYVSENEILARNIS